MIDFEHVTKVYETHNDENVALEDVSLHIDEGEFVFVLGHSGAGKSTFIKLMQMEEKPTEGSIILDGQDLTRLKRRKVPYLRREMGVVFQDFRLIPTMTVYENVAFAMRVTNISTKKIKARVPFALSLVGLEDKMDRLPDELSGGEQQRVAVARALVHGPKLIIADEPTGNLDPEMSMDIMQLFEAINKVNITVVVVTHEHQLVHTLAAKYHNRVITLAHGLVKSDTAHPEVAEQYAALAAERGYEDDEEYV
ncbi:MAG: cell division ATP-binding protein FtsE [Gemmiger sp.]